MYWFIFPVAALLFFSFAIGYYRAYSRAAMFGKYRIDSLVNINRQLASINDDWKLLRQTLEDHPDRNRLAAIITHNQVHNRTIECPEFIKTILSSAERKTTSLSDLITKHVMDYKDVYVYVNKPIIEKEKTEVYVKVWAAQYSKSDPE